MIGVDINNSRITVDSAEIDQMFGILEETGQLLKSKFIEENKEHF